MVGRGDVVWYVDLLSGPQKVTLLAYTTLFRSLVDRETGHQRGLLRGGQRAAVPANVAAGGTRLRGGLVCVAYGTAQRADVAQRGGPGAPRQRRRVLADRARRVVGGAGEADRDR